MELNQTNLAKKHNPKMIIAGGSAYARVIDFKRFRTIANEVGAYFLVDMAHFSGLVAGGVYPNPLHFADVVTSTTHKTLRGPRGGIVLTNDENLSKKINSALFPGLQGGPLMHVIAANGLKSRGINIVSGGTDTHLVLLDLRNLCITGLTAESALESVGITCNKNGVPFDPEKPAITSGIRLGTPAATTRGFGTLEFEKVANLIADVLHEHSKQNALSGELTQRVSSEVNALCQQFPIY